MPLTDTSWLPTWRFSLLSLLAVSSVATLLMSIATLAYQLRFTVGYNKPVPALLVCSSMTLIHSSLFLAPVTPTSSKQRRVFMSLQLELASLLVLGLFTLATLARLHSSTPGLFSACGGYFICVSLQADVALAWFSFLFIALLFFPLLLATIYHYRRTRSVAVFRHPFALFNWRVYNPGDWGKGTIGEGGMTVRRQKERGAAEAERDERFVIS